MNERINERANALADRLEDGARALVSFASGLTDAEWEIRVPRDGRKIGVIVHHVASVYPLEIQLAQTIAGGRPIEGVTGDDVNAMNAGHATARQPQPQSGIWTTKILIRPLGCRSTPPPRSRASSCSRITPFDIVTTTLRVFERR